MKFIKTLLYISIPMFFGTFFILGKFGHNYDFLAVLVVLFVWYLVYILRSDIPNLKGFQLYIRFIIQQTPSLLQIITFAGFITYFYKSHSEAAYFISLITTLLACLYLTMTWPSYLEKEGMSKDLAKKYDEQFRFFTLMLFFILILLLLKATNLLLEH